MARELPPVPLRWTDHDGWLRKLSETVNHMLDGRMNARGTFTLTANVASSVLSDARIGPSSHVSLEPTTANAAAESGGTAFYRSAITGGSATYAHANNAQADRTFSYAIHG